MAHSRLTATTQGRISAALGRIRAFDQACRNAEYTDIDEAWRLLEECRQALAAAMRECNGRRYSVHIRLADEIYAADEADAFDQMMEAFEDRSGFEIMGHDIIEEPDND